MPNATPAQSPTHAAPIVIVGAGLAGITLARELRRNRYTGALALVSQDAADFYAKPSLSNALTQSPGKPAAALVTKTGAQLAAELGLTLHAHTRVIVIDRPARTLLLHSASGPASLAYHKLVLAVGADPIVLPLQGNAADTVLRVNHLQDYIIFRQHLGNAHSMGFSKAFPEGNQTLPDAQANRAARVCILGGGLIGCEFANDLANAGVSVDLIEMADRPLAPFVPAPISAALVEALSARGVRWYSGASAQTVEKLAKGVRVTLSDGRQVDTDLVLSAVGLRARTALAQAAGLAVERGIAVDSHLQTNDPCIYALGDCAHYLSAGRALPFVQPIMLAAKALAQTLTGLPTPVAFPPMAVIVKTPSMPIACVAPAAGAVGHWHVEGEQTHLRALYFDAENHLRGFALSGSKTAERARWLAALGSVFPSPESSD
jgi:rubredoxin---NAD+ reductase